MRQSRRARPRCTAAAPLCSPLRLPCAMRRAAPPPPRSCCACRAARRPCVLALRTVRARAHLSRLLFSSRATRVGCVADQGRVAVVAAAGAPPLLVQQVRVRVCRRARRRLCGRLTVADCARPPPQTADQGDGARCDLVSRRPVTRVRLPAKLQGAAAPVSRCPCPLLWLLTFCCVHAAMRCA